MKRKVVFVLGPTGSGKTALAVKLAKKLGGEIISADSRQVYVGLDVGSGKDLEEYGNIKYHLIDVCVPEEKFTLFDWLKSAKSAIDDILKRGKLPIVVGGTVLYATALAEGYVTQRIKLADEKPELKYTRDELNSTKLSELKYIVKSLGINLNSADMENPRRLARAIERFQEGKKPAKKKPDFESLMLAIDVPRDELYKKIDERVEHRFEKQGMLNEVKDLIESGVSKDWLKSLGLEYKFITEHLEGNYAFDEMKQELKWKTHAYARRQLTWLRKQEKLIWVKGVESAFKLVEKFVD